MKRPIHFLLLAVLAAAISGCGSSTGPSLAPVLPAPLNNTAPAPVARSAFFVSADELRNELPDNRQLVVLAAQSVVEGRPVQVIPGATVVNVDDFAAFSLQPGHLQDADLWTPRLRGLGLSPESDVVVYDDGEMKFASRTRYLLTRFGVRRARMLLGGSAAALSLGSITPSSNKPGTITAQLVQSPPLLVDRQQVAAELNTDAILLDVRTPAEFQGTLLLPGDARPGHIPGARNLPEGTFFDAQGRLKSPTEISAIFAGFGLQPDSRIVVYCHDGAKSSLVATLLVESGYRDVRLYYASYQDWSKDFSLPVEL